MEKAEINFRSDTDLNTLFRDYSEKFIGINSSNVNDVNSKEFIEYYFVKNNTQITNIKQQLKIDFDTMDCNNTRSGTHYALVYPNAKESLATQAGNVKFLLDHLEKIEKYIAECKRLNLEIGIGME
ncbi:hypothetical protein [Neisseria weaveri]|uniref:Uncharacterized protein n=1 Tax=Neisseria weaveri TaxID=28091 RepID=A0A448VQT4_9NEIS|nr:hypothetical protein [Neisseria weaveri]EGV35778.1 hypothetical protein l11_19280 [Neisseria weaveri LMG 5135]VEJ52062.1 Uncharacterised protein [Neisseria weaveri]